MNDKTAPHAGPASPGAAPLAGRTALAFVDDIYEDLELWYPKLRLEEAGVRVDVAGLSIRQYAGKHGYPCTPDITIDAARAEDYDLLLVPGGFMPDKLRRVPKVLEICRWFHEAERPIAFICHAGWILISAKILRGVTATSTPGIRDDMENAGVTWVDAPVVVDRHFISARRPPDLPAFAAAMVAEMMKRSCFAEGKGE
jgi:protease I